MLGMMTSGHQCVIYEDCYNYWIEMTHTLSLSLQHTLFVSTAHHAVYAKCHWGLSLTHNTITIPSAQLILQHTHSLPKNSCNHSLCEIYFWFWPELSSVSEAACSTAVLPEMTSCFLPLWGVTCCKSDCTSHPLSIHFSTFETQRQNASHDASW